MSLSKVIPIIIGLFTKAFVIIKKVKTYEEYNQKSTDMACC